ncbi:MAG: EAL domain-containing protein, partial [Actinomycetota bacterium]
DAVARIAGAGAPHPSPADALRLLFLPLTAIGLVLLVRSRARRAPATLALDGLMGALLAAAVAAAAIVPHLHVGPWGAAVVIDVAYPAGDVVLVAWTAWALAVTGTRPARAWLPLLTGYAAAAVADGMHLRLLAAEGAHAASEIDALRTAGLLLVVVASWTPAGAVPRRRPPGAFTLIAPVAVSLTATALLAGGEIAGRDDAWPSPPATWLAVGTLVVAIARMGMTLHENLSLAGSRREALRDPLTGLVNRVVFRQRAAAAVQAAGAAGGAAAVMVIDVDRFKDVNDSLGHQRGDLLLEAIADRLRQATRAGEVVARLGGDEFAVLIPRVREASEALEAANRLRTAMSGPVLIGEIQVDAEASFGVALCPRDGEDVDTLLQHADVAMYVAKRDHAGARLYDPAEDEHSPERLELLGDLRRAIVNGEIAMAYQPKVELATGRVVGVEALMRWTHPRRGVIPPGEFIPLAERTSLMAPLTVLALESALRQVCAWDAAGLRLDVAVNLSARHLIDLDLPERLAGVASAWAVDHRRVELEVTESMLMANPARAAQVLSRLSAAGFRIAIDDFGVGHASLNYLTRFPVDTIKVDRSFVSAMARDARSAAIVRSVAQLGRTLGLAVVAEGIEDEEVLRAVVDAGCTLGQGWHLGKPMPPEDLAGIAGAPPRR